jgi:hypothetical protein
VLEIFNLLTWILLDRFRPKTSLEAEVLALRQQLNILRPTSSMGRLTLNVLLSFAQFEIEVKASSLNMLDRLILILL